MIYYLEMETEGIIPEEDFTELFRYIKERVVGSANLLSIEIGEVDEEELDIGGFDNI